MEMLSAETDSTYTFQGLKRRLGLHQEKLTRILRRLEDNNLVAKTEEGYRTLKHSRKTAQHLVGGEPVIRGQLPPGIDAQNLLGKIKGRWFKNSTLSNRDSSLVPANGSEGDRFSRDRGLRTVRPHQSNGTRTRRKQLNSKSITFRTVSRLSLPCRDRNTFNMGTISLYLKNPTLNKSESNVGGVRQRA